jgi:hypothetical protein
MRELLNYMAAVLPQVLSWFIYLTALMGFFHVPILDEAFVAAKAFKST